MTASAHSDHRVYRVVVPEPEGVGEWFRRILLGIAWYVQTGPRWDVRIVRDVKHRVDLLQHVGADGVIASVSSREPSEPWLAIGCPVVSVGTDLRDRQISSVQPDEEAVGRLGGEHLIERRFGHFAFVGFRESPASRHRLKGFESAVRSRGGLSVLETDNATAITPPGHGQPFERTLTAWLSELPKPVGIMCWNDQTAQVVLQCCRVINRSVPEEAAVIGVDDDEVWCGLSSPALTSVRTPQKRVGYQAAALLDRLMAGEATCEHLLVLPDGIQRRKSTDTTAVSDPMVVQALRYIRENVQRQLTVASVVDALCVGRRSLEIRFRSELGRSPLEEIHRVQLQLAEQLLRSTEMPVKTVATRSGFRDVNHLTRSFSQAMGVPPATFRKRTRGT